MSLITAHSGCDGTPDNSLEFVRYALSLSVDAFEIDIQSSKRGLIVTHDENPDSSTPLLGEVFSLMARSNNNNMKVNCDLKTGGLEKAVFEKALEYGVENRLVYSGSVNAKASEDNYEWQKNVDIYLNIEGIDPKLDNIDGLPSDELEGRLKNAVDMSCAYKFKAINIDYHSVTELFLKYCEKKGVLLSLWTVNDPEQIKRFIEAKVYNITTRKAANAAALLDEQRKKG